MGVWTDGEWTMGPRAKECHLDKHKPAGYRLLITSSDCTTQGEFRQWIIKVFRDKGRDAVIAHDGRRWRAYIPVSKYGE